MLKIQINCVILNENKFAQIARIIFILNQVLLLNVEFLQNY